jgi:CRISPR/Cas system-associated protein endoribonuclease Cas2
MKLTNKLFQEDSEQKELIQKISALCGLKKDIIKQVWQYTYFQVYLNLLEEKEDKHNQKSYNMINLPYIGKIVLRTNQEKELEPFIILNQDFKTMIKNIQNGDETGLIQFFQENFINKTIDNIVEVDNENT